MPQVSGNFSAYPVKVTLDGSGNGSVAFQAVGANVRISNLSVRVATQTAQAVATVYKNQVGTDYRLSGTNSGSSGDNLSIPTDLFDGERVIVVWTGGDPGAEATATFSGKQIPFDQVGRGEGGANWTSPIAAGDGSLIYPAIKSPNYVPNTSGWLLDRDGDADLNNVNVRGDLVVDGPGLAEIHIYNSPGIGAPTVEFMPDSAGANPGTINAQEVGGTGFLDISAPAILPRVAGTHISMQTRQTDPDKVQIGSSEVGFTTDLEMTDGNINLLGSNKRYLVNGVPNMRRWVNGNSKNTAQTPAANTEAVLLTIPTFVYKAGMAYEICVAMEFTTSVAPNGPVLRMRAGTTTAGTEIRQTRKPAINTAMHNGDFVCKFTVGASDINTALVLTGNSASAGFTFTQLASPICYVDVYEMGIAGNNPNVVQL